MFRAIKFKAFKAALGAAALLAVAGPAQAGPLLSSRVTIDGNNVAALQNTNVAGGELTDSGGVAGVASVSFTLTGIDPNFLPAPDLAAAVSVTTPSGGTGPYGTHTIKIELTQTHISSSNAISDWTSYLAILANTIQHNLLTNSQRITNVKTRHYADANNVAFGTGILLSGLTTAGGVAAGVVNQTGPANGSGILPHFLFSETVVITATLKGRGASLLATSQMEGVNVPEPATLALLGVGLLGLAAAQRGRRRRA